MDELESIYSDYDFSLPEDFNLDVGSLGANPDFGLNFDWDSISNFMADPQLFAAFAELNPEDAALLKDMMGGDYGFAPVGSGDVATGEGDDQLGGGGLGKTVEDESAAETKRLKQQANATPEGDETGIKSGVPIGNSSSLLKQLADALGLSEDTLKNLLLGGAGLLGAKVSYDDAKQARKDAMGGAAAVGGARQAVRAPGGTYYTKAAEGGIMSLDMAKGRYLDGSTDGMEDKVPAHIDGRRPAALSDGEFVIPADVVSHLGNGNSNAGAQRLYEMMDQVRQARTGTTKQGKQINPENFTKGVASFAGGGTVADQYGRKLTRANYEGKVDRQGIPDDDDDPFNYNPNARKYTNYNNELFLIPARNELDEPVRANLFAQDPTGERELIEKAYSAMPRDQLGNVFDQLDARDAWNVNQAAMGTAHESPWLLNPENRMMAVGIKDDIIGKPSVLLYNPNQGAGVFVNPYPRGLFGSVFQSGDPETDFQQALNLTPFEQYAMLNNIGPYSSDRIGSLDASMTDEERWAVYEGLKNLSGPLPKLTYQELERGYFNPIELNPFAPYTKKRANPEIRDPYEFYQKYLNLNPVDNLLPLYLSLNPLKP